MKKKIILAALLMSPLFVACNAFKGEYNKVNEVNENNIIEDVDDANDKLFENAKLNLVDQDPIDPETINKESAIGYQVAKDLENDKISIRFIGAIECVYGNNPAPLKDCYVTWDRTLYGKDGNPILAKSQKQSKKAYLTLNAGGEQPYTIEQYNAANSSSFTHFVTYVLKDIPYIENVDSYLNAQFVFEIYDDDGTEILKTNKSKSVYLKVDGSECFADNYNAFDDDNTLDYMHFAHRIAFRSNPFLFKTQYANICRIPEDNENDLIYALDIRGGIDDTLLLNGFGSGAKIVLANKNYFRVFSEFVNNTTNYNFYKDPDTGYIAKVDKSISNWEKYYFLFTKTGKIFVAERATFEIKFTQNNSGISDYADPLFHPEFLFTTDNNERYHFSFFDSGGLSRMPETGTKRNIELPFPIFSSRNDDAQVKMNLSVSSMSGGYHSIYYYATDSQYVTFTSSKIRNDNSTATFTVNNPYQSSVLTMDLKD